MHPSSSRGHHGAVLAPYPEPSKARREGYDRVHDLTFGEYMGKLEPIPHKSASEDLIAAGDKLFHGDALENDVRSA